LPTTSSNCCADHLLGDNRFFYNELRQQVDGGIWRPQLPDLGLENPRSALLCHKDFQERAYWEPGASCRASSV